MRIHHWMTTITGMVALLVAGASAEAQWPPPGPQGWAPGAASYPNSPAVQTPMAPPTFQPPFTTNNPAALYPPAPPPHAYPFPDVSPHLGSNVLQEQHYNRGGLWLNEVIHRDREWYGAVESMRMHFDSPGGAMVGSRIAPIRRDTQMLGVIPEDVEFNAGVGFADALLGSELVLVGPGAYPFPWIQIDDTTIETILSPIFIFPIRDVTVFEDNPSSPGIKLRGGFINSDGTGWGVDGWYALENHEFFQRGQDNLNGIPITQDLLASADLDLVVTPAEFMGVFANGLALINARVGALPLEENSGVIDTFFPGSGFTGTTQKFDLLYRLDIESEAASAGIHYYLGHLLNRDRARVVPFVSARYMYFNESFGFRGLDSGFGYELDLTDEPTFRPDDEIFGPIHPLLDSRLNSRTESHLAGPEIGVRVDLGRSDLLNIWLQTSFGLLANHEELLVQGENIGNAQFFNDLPPFGVGALDPSLDMFANDTRFKDVEQHTLVSPTFNLGINAEMDVLKYIPLLKLIPLAQHAQLSIGYNWLVVGNLARPADIVKWRGFPEVPEVRTSRDTFDAHQFSAGLSFER